MSPLSLITGSGCTLASACAASLAHGLDPVNAVGEALRYTWESLKHGFRPGMGQLLPNRLYWAWEMDEPERDKSLRLRQVSSGEDETPQLN